MPPLTIIGGLFYLAFGPFVVVRYQTMGAVVVGAISVGIGLTLLTIRRLMRTRSHGWVWRYHLPILVVAAVPTATLPLVTMFTGGEAYPATGMVIVLVLLGAVVQRSAVYGVMLVVLGVAWVAVAVRLGIPVTWVRFGTELTMVTLASVGLHLAVRRTVRRLEVARRHLDRLANTDELTGVASKRRTFDEGRRRLARLAAGGASLGAIYVDMDGLKSVNDTSGHAVGDAKLRLLAGVLRDSVRPTDLVGRVGGDEFLILVEGLGDDDVDQLRGRIDHALADHGLTASMGYATSRAGDEFADLVQAADQAMYARKRGSAAAASDT